MLYIVYTTNAVLNVRSMLCLGARSNGQGNTDNTGEEPRRYNLAL